MPRRRKSPYDRVWRKLSLRVRQEAGFRCEAIEGGRRCVNVATSCDHVVPIREAPELRLVRSNLRATCAKHNMGRVPLRAAQILQVNTSTGKVREW